MLSDTTLLSLGLQNRPNEAGDEGVTILRGERGIRAHISDDISTELDGIITKMECRGLMLEC